VPSRRRRMSREFKFKENEPNIEKLYRYALYKFPKHKKRLDYDEWGQFVMFTKNETTTIFYYVNGLGHLYYNVYKKREAKADKKIVDDFKSQTYSEDKLKKFFDKILVPLNR
jgi:hypothetical protein